MYHNFFIHSSVIGCLGCFHVLAIVNSAAINFVHVSKFTGYMCLFFCCSFFCVGPLLWHVRPSLQHAEGLGEQRLSGMCDLRFLTSVPCITRQIPNHCTTREVPMHLFELWLSQSKCPVVGLLEKAMAPHSSTLAWKIPWTVEPGGLQSMGSLRVGHD